MVSSRLLTVFLIVGAVVTPLTESSACVAGLFGNDCQFQCNCRTESKCTSTGDCRDGGVCKNNWFGPQCQYKYLTSEEGTLWLTDNDNTTCAADANKDTAEHLAVNYNAPFVFTWMRIVVNDPTALDDLHFTFANSATSNIATLDQIPLTKQRVSPTVLEVHGRLEETVSSIGLFGEGVGALCSLHVSRGRDVSIEVPPFPGETQDGSSAGGGEGTCNLLTTAHDLADDGSGEDKIITLRWALRFKSPITVNDVQLDPTTEGESCVLSSFTHLSAFYQYLPVDIQQVDGGHRLVHWVDTPIDTMMVEVAVAKRRLSICSLQQLSHSLCQIQVFGDNVCDNKRWGLQCDKQCQCANLTEQCYSTTGACVSGCYPGYTGPGCATMCPSGTYGKNCAFTCSEHCRFKTCDRADGHCSNGCSLDTPATDCEQVCNPGYFGTRCSQQCPENCADGTCDQVTGACASCAPGFAGERCDLECESGYYGTNCSQECNPNCKNGVCDHVTGLCTQGCEGDAFQPPNCQKSIFCSKEGWFGEDCKYKCRCAPGVTCDKNGNCAGNKCEDNWFGPQCQYRNMMTWATSMTVGEWVFDKDATNCSAHERNGSVDYISFVFHTVIKFTWLRLHVESHEAFSQITVTFTSSNGSMEIPKWMRRVRVSDDEMDIHAKLPQDIRSIILWGPGLIHLCAVYVSGGRDMSLKQSASHSGGAVVIGRDETSDWSADTAAVAVDGDDQTCIKPTDLHNFRWTVHYDWPVALTTIFLVTDDQFHCLSEQIHMDSYHFNQSLDIVMDHQDTPPPNQVKFNVMNDANVSSLTLTFRDIPDIHTIAGCRGKHNWALCEMQTFGDSDCGKGRWGRHCENTCTCADPEDTCIISTGMCNSGCKPGFHGEGCTENCARGRYGVDCVGVCSPFCQPGSCDPNNGTCYNGCLPGYSPPLCINECPPGLYGQECTETCPPTCLDTECHHDNGQCKQCKPGYSGERCEIPCPPTFYGERCRSMCSKACLGGLCEPVSGNCISCPPGKMGAHCDADCPMGKFGPNCSYACPKTCQGGHCSEIDGTCYSCIPGYQGLLCENTCPPKWYGQDCQTKCSTHCDGRRCDHVTGACLKCPAGRSGYDCDQDCPDGTYGANCNSTCSDKCAQGLCDSVTGTCKECAPGYYGDLCETECLETFYGQDCKQSCSDNCLSSLCDPVTGACLKCVTGKTGAQCQQDCPLGTYGDGCQKQCSPQCGGEGGCNPITGHCNTGCMPGYKGVQCKQECPEGTYGAGCTEKCSRHCVRDMQTEPEICEHDTGACILGCVKGYYGDTCDSTSALEAHAKDHPNLIAIAIGVTIGLLVLAGIATFCLIRYYNKYKDAKDADKVNLNRFSDIPSEDDLSGSYFQPEIGQTKQP